MKEEANPDYFQDIKSKLKKYIQQRMLLLRLQATEKITRIAAVLITVFAVALIVLFLLIFGSFTAAYWLSHITGSLTAGFGIVALFYFVVLLLVIFFFRKGLQDFFINKFIQLLNKKD